MTTFTVYDCKNLYTIPDELHKQRTLAAIDTFLRSENSDIPIHEVTPLLCKNLMESR